MDSSPSEASDLEFAFPPSGTLQAESRSSDELVDGEWTKVRCQAGLHPHEEVPLTRTHVFFA